MLLYHTTSCISNTLHYYKSPWVYSFHFRGEPVDLQPCNDSENNIYLLVAFTTFTKAFSTSIDRKAPAQLFLDHLAYLVTSCRNNCDTCKFFNTLQYKIYCFRCCQVNKDGI